MKKQAKPRTKLKQRLTKIKPLFVRFIRNNKKSWRVKTCSLKISSKKRIEIKFRKFITTPNRRSKKIKQYVFAFRAFNVKEVAIILIETSKRQKKKNTKTKFVSWASLGLSVAGFVGVLFFGFQILWLRYNVPPQVQAETIDASVEPDKNVVEEEVSPFLERSLPTSIIIPSIDVNSQIIKIGLQENGSIETPSLFSNNVGWYHYGPTPGELGPAIMVGHVDTYKGPSVFWNLSKLNSKDEIIIVREDSSIVQFKVNKIVSYSQDNFNTEEVYKDIDYAGLRIITCGGAFNYFTGRYTHNTVVFAEMVLGQ